LRPASLADRGVFADLDERVSLSIPPWMVAEKARLVVDKPLRTLTLVVGDAAVKTYPVALGFDPVADKVRQGDGRTPEGDFTIVEVRSGPDLPDKYGAASLLLSYPEREDAERGLRDGLLEARERDAIVAACESGGIPAQDTKLGGSIRIHGGGARRDWTLGCVAMRDDDILELLPLVRAGTRVTVRGADDAPPLHDADADGIPDAVDVLLGARKTALDAAPYVERYRHIPYPSGDVPRGEGVCSDVIVRALRNAGIDLQREIHEDAGRTPRAYPAIAERNPHIDHRRVRNQVRWFARHWRKLPPGAPRLGGDVVFIDTFPHKPGPDHVGIVSDAPAESGLPAIINSWTYGFRTGEMDLLLSWPVTDTFRAPL
jgi:uncharacterized protein YijF (DUF1287 family)